MHNFPHQFSDLDKLYEALLVVHKLAAANTDIGNDEELGVALAKAGVYAFRGGLPLAEALKREKEKPRASRGTETAARDLRRLFVLAKLIVKDDSDARFSITPAGNALLNSSAGTQRSYLWRVAMLGLTLDTGHEKYSHPYQVLVRLVNEKPGIEKQKLLLALEANDDSESEFSRLLELSEKSFDQIVKKIGASKSGAANAIKILPSIAQQLGDFIESKGACYPSAVPITTEEGSIAALRPSVADAKLMPAVLPSGIAVNPTFTESVSITTDLAEAIALRKKRTVEHNSAVRSLAALLHKSKFKLHEYPFDCLAIDSNDRSILIEVKTLDGSLADERQQSERALGQLKSYRFFAVPEHYKAKRSIDVAAFTKKPSISTIRFLLASGIVAIWEESGQWKVLDKKEAPVTFSPTAALAP